MKKAFILWTFLVSALVLVALVTGYYAQLSSIDPEPERFGILRPDDPLVIEEGARIYAQNCASCHGDRLQGEPDWQSTKPDGTLPAPPHDETGHTWHHADDLLFRITKFGTAKALSLKDFKSNMPAFEDLLTDREIISALSFIKAQWPQDVRSQHDQLNANAINADR